MPSRKKNTASPKSEIKWVIRKTSNPLVLKLKRVITLIDLVEEPVQPKKVETAPIKRMESAETMPESDVVPIVVKRPCPKLPTYDDIYTVDLDAWRELVDSGS